MPQADRCERREERFPSGCSSVVKRLVAGRNSVDESCIAREMEGFTMYV